MTLREIEAAADKYAGELEAFIEHYDLPEEWFGAPDHIAVKCLDRADFDAQIDQLREYVEGDITGVDMHGRTLATVRLVSSMAIGSFGEVRIIEVMEPRPEKAGKGLVGLEHMEFTFPDFAAVTTHLDDYRVEYEVPTDNPHHGSVNVLINNAGQELKLNDRSLSDINIEETENGENYVL